MISCRQRIRWMISFAITYAGAAFAPKIAVTGAAGILPALISRYLSIIYNAFNCWRLYSWSLLIWISKIVSGLISISCVSFRYLHSAFLFSFLIFTSLSRTFSSSWYFKSFSSSAASFLYPSPISESISSVRAGLQWSSQRRNVIPLVLLLNFSG